MASAGNIQKKRFVFSFMAAENDKPVAMTGHGEISPALPAYDRTWPAMIRKSGCSAASARPHQAPAREYPGEVYTTPWCEHHHPEIPGYPGITGRGGRISTAGHPHLMQICCSHLSQSLHKSCCRSGLFMPVLWVLTAIAPKDGVYAL